MLRPILCLLIPLTLAACGELPEPFLGNPGANGRLLSQPPTPRLAVPPPPNALLPDASAQALAADLAQALQAKEVPAVSGPANRGDWHLVTTATDRGTMVVPEFTVLDPQGKERGKVEGSPVSTAAWSAAEPATLRQTANDAAANLTLLLTNIEIARQHADPNSLYNRKAKVMVAKVTGAPGDGDTSLTNQMRTHLALLGPIVQTTPGGADFTVQGDVKVVPVAGRQERVEIQWTVKAANGDERGRVVQLNLIPAGSLDHYWGDVAVVVATEASGGVNDVIIRQSGHEPGDQQGAKPAAQPVAVRGQDSKPLVEGQRPGTGQPAR